MSEQVRESDVENEFSADELSDEALDRTEGPSHMTYQWPQPACASLPRR